MPQKSPKGTVRPPMLGRQDVCPHTNREPVELLATSERVAQLCVDCDKRLGPYYVSDAEARLLVFADYTAIEAAAALRPHGLS